MPIIKFKATRRSASSCDSYREIEKSGDIESDVCKDSDDVIMIEKSLVRGDRIIIDCDKKTGVFSLKF